MKKFLIFIILFVFSFKIHAQNGPKIEFKSLEIDYGTISKSTDNGIRYFEFTNIGNTPLIIKNVQSTCGCAVTSFPKVPVAPGQQGSIEVKYNMAPGPIRKSFLVESNAVNSDGGFTSLKIKGMVKTE